MVLLIAYCVAEKGVKCHPNIFYRCPLFINKNCIFFKGWHPCGVHLKYICIKSHISTYKQCVGITTNRAATISNLQMVSLRLEMMNQPSSSSGQESQSTCLDDSCKLQIALISSSDLWSLGSIQYSNENCIAMVHL